MKKLKNFSVISMFPLEKHIVCHVYYKQYKLVQYKYYAPIIFMEVHHGKHNHHPDR